MKKNTAITIAKLERYACTKAALQLVLILILCQKRSQTLAAAFSRVRSPFFIITRKIRAGYETVETGKLSLRLLLRYYYNAEHTRTNRLRSAAMLYVLLFSCRATATIRYCKLCDRGSLRFRPASVGCASRPRKSTGFLFFIFFSLGPPPLPMAVVLAKTRYYDIYVVPIV